MTFNNQYYFLFDTSVFQKLCRDNSFYSSFLKSMEENNLNPKEFQEGFYITPFSVLEAIGVRPAYKKIECNFKDSSIINFLSQEIRNYFENLDDINSENLKLKAQKNRPINASEGQNYLYELCVERCVNEDDFHQMLIYHLVLDYLYKYQYKNKIFENIFDILKLHLFDKALYEISKFRLLSNLYDKNSPRISTESIGTERAKLNTNKSLKTQLGKDYLDSDIVHSVCMGHLAKDGLYPVVGFTFDNYNEILSRISAYKGFIYGTKKDFLNSNFDDEEYIFNNTSGIICFLNSDGMIEKKINVIDIPVTGHGSEDSFITQDYKKFEMLGFENYLVAQSTTLNLKRECQ